MGRSSWIVAGQVGRRLLVPVHCAHRGAASRMRQYRGGSAKPSSLLEGQGRARQWRNRCETLWDRREDPEVVRGVVPRHRPDGWSGGAATRIQLSRPLSHRRRANLVENLQPQSRRFDGLIAVGPASGRRTGRHEARGASVVVGCCALRGGRAARGDGNRGIPVPQIHCGRGAVTSGETGPLNSFGLRAGSGPGLFRRLQIVPRPDAWLTNSAA